MKKLFSTHLKNRKYFPAGKKGRKGFSLAEVLLVVAILGALFALGVPAVFTIQKNLRQTELDAKAETLYMAVQNRMSKMKAAGKSGLFQKGQTGVYELQSDVPSDVDEDKKEELKGEIVYFTSDDLNENNPNRENTAAYAVMMDSSMEELLVGSHWVVEYNPSSAIVYAVFYSEDRANCADEYVDDYSTYNTSDPSYRDKKGRLNGGAKVGYYGGGSAESDSKVTELTPTITVENAETLTVQIKCTVPKKLKQVSPVFKVEMEDTAGNVYTAFYAYTGASSTYREQIRSEVNSSKYEGKYPELYFDTNDNQYGEAVEKSEGRTYTLNITLDDLSSDDSRFVNKYGEKSDNKIKLLSGTPLKITVTVMCPGNDAVTRTHSASVITNSLFADLCSDSSGSLNKNYGKSDTYAAVITCGRHLQNLDQDSGVDSSIAYAVQGANIAFTDVQDQTGVYDWYETYAGNYFNGYCKDGKTPNFKPITNTNLINFKGNTITNSGRTYYTISDLSEYGDSESTSDLGLFSTLSGEKLYDSRPQTVENVIMTGTNLITEGSGTSVGAIAGLVTGNAAISNCWIYLTGGDIGSGTEKKTNDYIWISGTKAAGGLVGAVQDGTVSITGCSASTVIGGYDADAVKRDAGTIRSIESFTTAVSGGLIGAVNGGTVSISTSYADCYLAGTITGGLVGTGSDDLKISSCYAAGFMSFTNVKKSAGLVDNAGRITSSYSVSRGLYLKNGVTLNNTISSCAGSRLDHVYYMPSSAENLGDSFTVLTEDPYKTYQLTENVPATYIYPVLKNLTHYGDYAVGYTLTLKNGTASDSDTVWSSIISDEGVSGEVNNYNGQEYTAPTSDDWTLTGWYADYEKDSSGKPSGILVLDKEGNITADAGTYSQGFTITETTEDGKTVKTLTLSGNVTLYACWYSKKGDKAEIYVLTNTFSYGGATTDLPTTVVESNCKQYVIASGNTAGSVDIAGVSGASLTSGTATVLTDGKYSSSPYIMADAISDAFQWTAVPSRSFLNTTSITNLEKATGWGNNNTSTDYGAAFHLRNSEYYLDRNVTSSTYTQNKGEITLTKELYESDNAWSFENRMFRYSTDNLRGRFGGSDWKKVLYFEYSDGNLTSNILNSGDNVPSGSKKAYIYEKVTVNTESETYTFDIKDLVTLTYKDGSTFISEVTYSKGATAAIAGYPANKSGADGSTLVCDGWSTGNGEKAVYHKDDTPSIDADTVLYAHWTTNYTITYYLNGGTMKEASQKTVSSGGTEVLPTPDERTEYTFAGWYDQNSGQTLKEGTSVTVTQDKAYSAQWKAEVTFNNNGHGTAPGSQNVIVGGKVSEPTEPSAEGYTFAGWFTDADCTDGNEWNFDTDLISKPTTLYAKWTVSVTFDANGHGTAPEAQTGLTEGAKASEPAAAPTASGYIFGGWYKEKTCSTAWNFNTDSVTKNTTLYAKWTNGLEIKKELTGSTTVTAGNTATYKITVTNNTDAEVTGISVTDVLNTGLAYNDSSRETGEVAVTNQTVVWRNITVAANSSQVLILTVKTKDNFKTQTSIGNTAVLSDADQNEIDKADSGSVTVNPKKFAVTYIFKGSTIPSGAAVPTENAQNYGTEYTSKQPTAVSGWTFDGWYTDENCTSKYTDGTEITAALNLYGKWTQDGYTLTLQNGTNSTSNTVWKAAVSSENISDIKSISDPKYTAPSASGWTLEGWYTGSAKGEDGKPSDSNIKVLNADGTVVSGLTLAGYAENGKIKLTENRTLYACWKKGVDGEAYVLVDSFTDKGEYIIANGTSGQVSSVYLGSVSSGGTTASLSNTKLTVTTDGVYFEKPYIMSSNQTAFTGSDWNQLVWKAEAFSYTNAEIKEKYSVSFDDKYEGTYNGFYLINQWAVNQYSTNWYLYNKVYYQNSSGTSKVESASSILWDNSASVDSFNYEFRMWKYSDGLIPCYGHDKGCWNQIAYYSGDSILTTAVSKANTVSMPSGGSKIYIYQKQTFTEEYYAFDTAITVTYKDGDSVISENRYLLEGADANVTLIDNNKTKTDSEGKTFACDGWSTTSGGSKVYSLGDSVVLNEDTILYAHWAEEYKLTYKDGDTTFYEQTFTQGSSVIIAGYPDSKTDSNNKTLFCDGWSESTDGDVKYKSGDTAEFIGDKELYAHWSDGCTLKLVGNGSETYTVVPGTAVSLSDFSGYTDLITRTDGWTFDGWCDSSKTLVINKDGKISAGTITGDTTLYARWKRTAYVTVTATVSAGNYVIGSTVQSDKVYTMAVSSNTLKTVSMDYSYDTVYTSDDGSSALTTGYAYVNGSTATLWTLTKQNSGYYIQNNSKYLYVSSGNNGSNSLRYGDYSSNNQGGGNNNTYNWTVNTNTSRIYCSGVSGDSGNPGGPSGSGNPGGPSGASSSYYLQISSSGVAISNSEVETCLYSETTVYTWSAETLSAKAPALFSSMLMTMSAPATLSASAEDEVKEENNESLNATADFESATTYMLTLMNGSEMYLTESINSDAAAMSSYTTPERTDSSWRLDGWYTAADSSGEKVLNADGSVVSENIDGYTSDGSLELTEDTTLYARWSRLTDVYVLSDSSEPEKDTEYLIAAVADENNETSLLALGRSSSDDEVYTQAVTAHDPSSETSEYVLYNEETEETSDLESLYITDVPENLTWICTDEDPDEISDAMDRFADYLRAKDENAGWRIVFYKKTKALQTSFSDEILTLTLSQDTTGTAYSVRIVDGAWAEWNELDAPEKDGYHFLGWYDSSEDDAKQILTEKGLLAGSDIEGYVTGGRWTYNGDNLILYAKWEKLTEEAVEESEENETAESAELTQASEESETIEQTQETEKSESIEQTEENEESETIEPAQESEETEISEAAEKTAETEITPAEEGQTQEEISAAAENSGLTEANPPAEAAEQTETSVPEETAQTVTSEISPEPEVVDTSPGIPEDDSG